MSDLRFRSSGNALLMTNKKGVGITAKQLEYLSTLTDKLEIQGKLPDGQMKTYNDLISKRDAPLELSDTAKSWIEKLWRKRECDVEEFLSNKYLEKGLSMEEQGVSLAGKLDGNIYKKNEKKFDNGVLSGTPDILWGDYVDDIKVSWSMETFMNAKFSDLYYGQLQSYMELTGKRKARLRYCLLNTPDKLIDDEKRRVMWKLGITDETLDEHRHIFQQIETNNFFNHIPIENRVRTFETVYNPEYIEELYRRCEAAGKYYYSIKLGSHEFYEKH